MSTYNLKNYIEQPVGLSTDNIVHLGGTAKKIKITVDGVVHYINAYTG